MNIRPSPTAPRPASRHAVTMVILVLSGFGLLTPTAMAGQEPGSVIAADARVEGRSYLFESTGVEVPYALFVPEAYDATREWPLIVALHGLGRPYDWMMGYDGFIDFAQAGGFIVVAPLGYHPRGWYGSRGYGIPAGAVGAGDEGTVPENLGELSEQDVMNVLRITRDAYNVDPDRIYLWGHSMGGAGTYHLAARFPDIWAGLAVAAPAPRADAISEIERFRDIPVLILHGDEDATVSVNGSRTWSARMRELGMQHVYIEIPGADHSIFMRQNPENLSKVFSFFDIVRKDYRSAER